MLNSKRAPQIAGCIVGVLLSLATNVVAAQGKPEPDQVKTEAGVVAGTMNADGTVRMFKGVPFAAPPVGDLRWKAPQPAAKWSGVRPADKFGPACLQNKVFNDIFFRDAQPSEDCLNLNIWIPAKATTAKLPVFVWFYGGGFVAGGSSEPRYDGENLAKKGVIVVSSNYRLGIFGFYSHPELTKESGHNASGNYGLMDQAAALKWVANNIAAFGGNPNNVTIGGESAGSFSVSALMASPIARGLFHKAIGESGAFFPSSREGTLPTKNLAITEQEGVEFAQSIGATSLAQMRAKTGDELLAATAKPDSHRGFRPNIDGYYLTTEVASTYAAGKQAHVPLLAGWNADEGKMQILFSPQKPTAKSFGAMAEKRFGNRAGDFLKLYPATTDQEAVTSAEQLASDDFIAYSTWKWLNMQLKTGDSPVYTYHFEQVPATKPDEVLGGVHASEFGSKHAGEIEYVFQTLKLRDEPWTADDFKISDVVSSYWANFIATGNPNGGTLPQWPAYRPDNNFQLMHLSSKSLGATPEVHRDRYLFLDEYVNAKEAPAQKK